MANRGRRNDAFMREAVYPTRQPDASVAQVAGDIGISAGHMFRWRRELEADGRAGSGWAVARDQEVLALKREPAG